MGSKYQLSVACEKLLFSHHHHQLYTTKQLQTVILFNRNGEKAVQVIPL